MSLKDHKPTHRNWAKACVKADRETFESYVQSEENLQQLTANIEAEAMQDDPRAERIAIVNQRKQEIE
jgi:alpha-D-ribose 1-methylphosphonate 5-triphosphate diphosphatase PhnM